MSKQVLSLLQERFGAKILAVDSFRGDDEALIAPEAWHEVALFLRDDAACTMDHFIDLTAVDYPEREPEQPRFDVVVSMRSLRKNHRLRIKRVGRRELDRARGVRLVRRALQRPP